MKKTDLVISFLVVVVSAVLCARFISHSLDNQRDKADLATLNHVTTGLFSVDEWKKQITAVVSDEIKKLYLTKAAERELKKRLEVILGTLIDKVYEQIKKGNGKSAGGRVKQSFIEMFIDIKEVKKGVPQYADALLGELKKAKTQAQVKALLHTQVERYIDSTFDAQDTSRINAILERVGAPDVAAARALLDEAVADRKHLIRGEALLLALLPAALFAWTAFGRRELDVVRYVLLLAALAILLVAGVTTPMIDMEAKISRMAFVLLGHPVQFENQVLFYQSKSILDVFWIMIRHRDLEMKLVGVLLVVFSVLFPLLKMLSLPAYHFDLRGLRKNQVVAFCAVKSGKWSMADVMVVAIFMAYIGFNGIISSQLGQLASAAGGVEVMTTNGTALQPGYYLFLSYVVLTLVFSGLLGGRGGRRERDGLPRSAQG